MQANLPVLHMAAIALAMCGAAPAEGDAPATFVLTGLDGPSCRIVVETGSHPAVGHAARALQQCIETVSGVTVPIEEGPAGPGTISFRVDPEDARLREDGVAIRVEPKSRSMVLTGQNARAVIYSVYVFAERYLDMRFLTADCVVAAKRPSIALPAADYTHSPPFMYRETLYFDSFPEEIALRHRLNGPMAQLSDEVGGKWAFHPYVHSFWQLVPAETYFEEHPEYYSLVNGERTAAHIHGQLCLTNPDVLAIATRQVLQWIDEHPEVPIIDVSQNDGNGWCECDACTKVAEEEGSQHGPILRFVNAIADVVAEKHPDKWIETLAYAYATKPPALTKPRDNVIIRLCHAGCYFHGFEQCGLGANLTTYLEEWSQQTQRIFIWHYATNFAHYIAPNQNLRGLASDIQYYAAHGVNGLMIQGNYQSHGGELAKLRQYVAAQLMWDPGQDVDQLILDFCNGYYGSVAPRVMTFLSLMDEVAKDPEVHAFGAWDPVNTVTPAFLAEALAVLEGARRSAGPAVAPRIDELLLPLWYMQLCHPDRYGLDRAEGNALLAAFRAVAEREGITHINEGKGIGQWFDEMAVTFAESPPGLVYDLYAHLGDAVQRNCMDWRASAVHRNAPKQDAAAQDALLPGAPEKEQPDEVLAGIFHHPPLEGWGEGEFTIALPEIVSGQNLSLRFGTGFTAETENGVDFAVDVNGENVWRHTQTAQSVEDHVVDLLPWAGQEVRLTLRVHNRGNGAFDWAHWVRPQVLQGDGRSEQE